MPQCENINIFGYLLFGGGGGSGYNNQTGSILVYLYPLIYINLHVKYENKLCFIGGGGGGPVALI